MADGQRETLTGLSGSRSAPMREVQLARVLPLAADGAANYRIGAEVGVRPATVSAWGDRFAVEGVVKFGQVRKGHGPKPTIRQSKVDKIVELTLDSTPDGGTHWLCRSMAEKVGVSKDTVQRVWSARRFKPHLVTAFTVSNDPLFDETLIDVVGSYLDPPDNAVLLCSDEKSSVQAWTAPSRRCRWCPAGRRR